MGIDGGSLPTPLAARIKKVAQPLFLLGIHTQIRPTGFGKGRSLADQVLKLPVSVRVRLGMKPLDVALGPDVLLIEQRSDRFPA